MNGRPKVKYATINATGDVMAFTDDVEEGQEYRYRARMSRVQHPPRQVSNG